MSNVVPERKVVRQGVGGMCYKYGMVLPHGKYTEKILWRSGTRTLKLRPNPQFDDDTLFNGNWNLAKFTDYEKLEKLGEGTYGVVSKVKHRPSGTIVAFKKVKLEMEEEGIPATTIREVSLLKTLVHKHVVKLYDFIMNKKNLYLVFEFVPMDMQKFIQNTQPIDIGVVKRMCLQLFSGINFCHNQGVLHRDLKPQNLLVDSKGDLKIADFGLGRDHGVPMSIITHEVVTLWYRCPEILLGSNKYGSGVDVWAIGCIAAELHLYRALFRGDSEIDQLFQIFRWLGTPTEDTWAGVKSLQDHNHRFPMWKSKNLRTMVPTADAAGLDLIRRCLTMDPRNRFSAAQGMSHPWFKGVDPDNETCCPEAFGIEDVTPMYSY